MRVPTRRICVGWGESSRRRGTEKVPHRRGGCHSLPPRRAPSAFGLRAQVLVRRLITQQVGIGMTIATTSNAQAPAMDCGSCSIPTPRSARPRRPGSISATINGFRSRTPAAQSGSATPTPSADDDIVVIGRLKQLEIVIRKDRRTSIRRRKSARGLHPISSGSMRRSRRLSYGANTARCMPPSPPLPLAAMMRSKA